MARRDGDRARGPAGRGQGAGFALAFQAFLAAALGSALVLAVASVGGHGSSISPPEPEPRQQGSRVEIHRVPDGRVLLRDGQPFVVKGMGYSNLVPAQSAHDRVRKWKEDLALIAASGFNALNGWVDQHHTEPWSIDLLDIAHAEGLSVIVPFYLPAEANYADPRTQARLRAAVAEWVERYKHHPALLMWGLGNETLSEIGPDQGRAEAFAAFYWHLADLVHALDPAHPVTYRAAEERYVGPLQAAYERSGKERPWFVLGMNVYSSAAEPRNHERVLYEAWPQRGWDVAAYVSEFNTVGLHAEARPEVLLEMWRAIRGAPRAFLGGAIYVWSTAGPEKVDPEYGLVDGLNQPVDRSLDLMREELAGDEEALSADEREH